jgi:hypothetical protein
VATPLITVSVPVVPLLVVLKTSTMPLVTVAVLAVNSAIPRSVPESVVTVVLSVILKNVPIIILAVSMARMEELVAG